jgi:hypothetical protein
VDEEVIVSELEVEEFGAATDIHDFLPNDLFPKFFGRGRSQRAFPAQVHIADLFANQCRLELTGKGFDFGEFGHIEIQ